MTLNTFDVKKAFIEEGQKLVANENSSFLKEYREKNLSLLKESNFPHKKMEEWRFTPIEDYFSPNYKTITENKVKIQASDLKPYIDFDNELPLVFINGIFAEEFSFKNHEGIQIQSLKDSVAEESQSLNLLLETSIPKSEKFFVKLNETFINNGILVTIKNKEEISKTIHILHMTTNEAEDTFRQPRHIFWAQKLSKSKIIESYASLNKETSYTTNSLTDLILEEGSSVQYNKIQDESTNALHIHHLRSVCSRDAHLKLFSYNGGSKLSRNDFDVKINGSGTDCDLNGLTVLNHKQQSDNYIIVDHEKEHSSSHQYFKYILAGESHGVFDGQIIIRPKSQHIEANQLNKNLLLSKKAHIDTKPQLEVYADDVKCQHGATIGQMSEEELFYLQSRGIDPEKAGSLLSYAFAFDVIDKIPSSDIKSKVSKIFEKNFKVEVIDR